jgi:hypothetical protein
MIGEWEGNAPTAGETAPHFHKRQQSEKIGIMEELKVKGLMSVSLGEDFSPR